MAEAEQNLQTRVAEFFSIQKRQRIISLDHSLTILKLIDQCKPTPLAEIPLIFEQVRALPQVNGADLDKIQHYFQEALSSLNELNPARRFFTLELLSLFNEPEKLRITLETLLLANQKQLDKIAHHYLTSYKGTSSVINILAGCDEIYTKKESEIQGETLFSFRTFFAQRLLGLFPDYFLEEQEKVLSLTRDHPDELLSQILLSQGTENLLVKLHPRNQLFIRLAELVSFAQSHRWQPIYAKKRYDYLRLYLQNLTAKPVIKGIAPANLAKIVACFLFCNQQLQPNNKLIQLLVGAETHDTQGTQESLETFLSHLAPSTIDALLSDIQEFLKQFLQNSTQGIQKALALVSKKYQESVEDTSVLGVFYTAVMDLKQAGIAVVNSLGEFSEELIGAFNDEQGTGDQTNMNHLFGDITHDSNQVAPSNVTPKNKDSYQYLAQYSLVSTNITGFQGTNSGCGKHNFEGSLELFGGKQGQQDAKIAIQHLLNYFQETRGRAIVFNEFPNPKVPETKITESQLSILLPIVGEAEFYLLCLGTNFYEETILSSNFSQEEQNQSCLIPYCLLFSTSNNNTVMSALSRHINTQDKNIKDIEFKPLNQKKQLHNQICTKALYDVFHYLPFNHWEENAMQNLLIHFETVLQIPLEKITSTHFPAI